MPNLGSLYYPTISVSEASQIAVQIENEYGGSITVGGLATHLGMAENGGGFRHKVASLGHYGLLVGRGTLTITELGQRIAHPSSAAEREEALREAFLNIDLFQRLRERFGSQRPTDGQLRVVLDEISGAQRRDVAARLARIRRLYEDGLNHFVHGADVPSEQTPQANSVEVGVDALIGEREPPFSDSRGKLVLSDGQVRLPVERSVRGIRLLRKYLDLMEEQLQMEADGVGGDDLE